MRKVLVFSICLCFGLSLQAQFGIKGSYHFSDAADWQVTSATSSTTESVIGNGWSVGVDYWFRLKNYRVEFLPELNYSQLNQDFSSEGWTNNASFTSFFFNTNIYLFDIKGDCGCPTFSKQGPKIGTGIFVQISPGLTYAGSELVYQEQTFDANDISLSIGAAIGLDVGLSDLVTVTPMIGLRYFPSISWDSLGTADDESGRLTVDEASSSLSQWYAGVRVGFRLDQ